VSKTRPKLYSLILRIQEDLAAKLGTIWTHGQPGPDLKLEALARQTLPGRLRSFAEKFLAVSDEVYEKSIPEARL
jgi:hypothetical protein